MSETREMLAATPPKKRVNHIVARWTGGTTFEAGRPAGPFIAVDTSGKVGPGPVDVLLCALATCSSIDVVEILAKRRTPVSKLEVSVHGERATETPARLTDVTLAFEIEGEGIDRPHAERAIDLAVTKYCSVKDSLDPALPVHWTLRLNGQTA
ncbi:MAG: OsmC family protein [Gemmatimonadaceae bacterium]